MLDQDMALLPTVASPGLTHLTRQDCIDLLTKLILDTIDPDTWRDNGGTLGSIREFDGFLAITHTPTTHRHIQRILANLRKLRAAVDRGEQPTTRPINLLE
jgi:hypothetical protein